MGGPESDAGAEGFMLTEQPGQLDIVQMLGDQQHKDEAEG